MNPMMKPMMKNNTVTREAIMALLTGSDADQVRDAEEQERLTTGDEYVDLDDLGSGIHRVAVVSYTPPDHVITRSSVCNATWVKIACAIAQ